MSQPPPDPAQRPRRGLSQRLVVWLLLVGLVLVGTASWAGAVARPEGQPAAPAFAAAEPVGVDRPVRVDASAAVPDSTVTAVSSTAQLAWRKVLTVWGTTPAAPPRISLVLGTAALAAAAGRSVASTTGLVAVTTADRVVVDASAYAPLAPVGRLVLLEHELTHLATGAAADPTVPTWLEEGFADYVGFLGSGVSAAAVGRAAIVAAQAHGAPTAPPTDAMFSGDAATESAAYAEAWLLCRSLADRYGESDLVAIYHRVAHGGMPLPQAVQDVTGHPWSDALNGWRADLAALAGLSR